MRQSATVQHIAPFETLGTRRLWNQSRNFPLESGGGAADADMLMKSTTVSDVRRILILPPGSLSCSDRHAGLRMPDEPADLSMIAGTTPETGTKSG